jgi:2'-5' RNA ligase
MVDRATEARALGVSSVGERMFLAVELDDTTRHALATRLEASLDGELLPGRPVRPQHWHITLRFLGSTTARQRDQLLAHLDQHLIVAPFRLRFQRLGAFPRERKASVLWLGIGGGAGPLQEMAAICEAAAQEAGLEPEGRPFHPHLTLSRIRPPVDLRALVDRVEPFGVVGHVTAVTLYRSLLGRESVRYEVVDRVAL